MAGSVYSAMERLAAYSRAEGDALYGAFTSHPDSPRVAFVPAVLIGLASAELYEAHKRQVEEVMETLEEGPEGSYE